MSRIVLAAGQLCGAIILVVAAVDYQQLAIERCDTQFAIRHLLRQALLEQLPELSDFPLESRLACAQLENDSGHLVSRELVGVLRQQGFLVDATCLQDFSPAFFWPGSRFTAAKAPDFVLRGRVEQLVSSPIDSARIRLHLEAIAAEETSPRWERSIYVSVDRERLFQELSARQAGVIPHWFPQIGGAVIPLDEGTLTAIPLLVGLVGGILRRSRRVWPSMIYFLGLVVVAISLVCLPTTTLPLVCHTVWSVLFVGAVVFITVSECRHADASEEIPVRRRYPRLAVVG